MVDAMHDFDFLFGRWIVHNERLVARLVGSTDWERFTATNDCRPILGGVGNVDEFVTAWGGGFRGATIRLFDLERAQWSIYWASNRTGLLDPPMVGRFDGGVGSFFGHDHHQGTPVRVRFVWSEITAVHALWQQAFSTDDGATWETNWRMAMTRAPAA